MSKSPLAKEVCAFIKHFCTEPNHEMDKNFLFGNCYWFARILQERFSVKYYCTLLYNPIDNHFCCSIEGECFDASGKLYLTYPEEWVQWEQHIIHEPLNAARVYRDCIWHMDKEQWYDMPEAERLKPWSLSFSQTE